MGMLLVLLYPLAYIFCYVDVKPFGPLDQFLILIAAFFIFCKRMPFANNIPTQINFDNKIIIFYFLYCIASLLSVFNNPESDLSSIYHTFTILAKPGIALVVFFAITSIKDLRYCIMSMIVFVILVFIYVVFLSYTYHNIFFLRSDYYLSTQEGISIFSSPNRLIRVIILIAPLIFVFSFYLKNKVIVMGLRFLIFLCLLLPIIGISRASTVAMSLIMLILFWKTNKKIMIFAQVFILIIGVSVFVVHKRFAEVLEKGYSVGHREETAEISIKSIKKNPFLGTGKRTSIEILEKERGPTIGLERQTLYEHNLYLTLLVEGGIVGLIFFLCLIWFYINNLITNIKRSRNLMLKNLLFANLMGFLGFMLTTPTGGTINENVLWYQIGIGLAIIKLIAMDNVTKKVNVPKLAPIAITNGIRISR